MLLRCLTMAFHLLFVLLLHVPACCLSSSAPTPDTPALLTFKSACSDPEAALASWAAPSNPCSGSWRGVSCSPSSPPRVRRVVLEGLRLAGDTGAVAALAQLPFLFLLSLKNNSFAGPLHSIDFSPSAPHLKLLYLSGNRFFGRFPESVLRLRHLHRLDLSENRLTGVIPPEIGHHLPALLTLRLDRNLFVGPVPASLGAMAKLAELSIARNHLKGKIPRRLAAAFPASSFAGNLELCGDPLPRRCNDRHQVVYVGGETEQEPRRRSHNRWTVVMIVAAASVAVGTVVAAALGTAVWLKGKKESAPTGPRRVSMAREEMVRFDGCCPEFDVGTMMRGAAEMLGKGAAGTTYRVVVGGDMVHEGEARKEPAVVVVKRMRREGGGGGSGRDEEKRRRELAREMGAWRHANIVSLRAFYTSPEEMLLVLDYLPNGSLHSLLHDNRGPARIPLDWHTRLKLAQEAAQGLDYLHGVSKAKFSHGHLTSSNILVDADGNARVSDSSLLQLLAPVVSAGEAFQKQDVYSFGVVLLEILTGRSPEDGKVDLALWVRTMVREEWTSDVFDVELLQCRGAEDEMVALLQVAMLCVADEPRDRPRMTVVAKMIEEIRDRGSKRSKYWASSSQAVRSYESSAPCISEDTSSSRDTTNYVSVSDHVTRTKLTAGES